MASLNAYLAEHGDAHTVRAYGRIQQRGQHYGGLVSNRGSGKATYEALKAAGHDSAPPNSEALVSLRDALVEHLGVEVEYSIPSWLRN